MRDLSRRIGLLEKLAKPVPVGCHMPPAIQEFLDGHRSDVQNDRRTANAMQLVFQNIVARETDCMPIASFSLLLAEEEKLNQELECGATAAASDSEIAQILGQRYSSRRDALGATGVKDWYYGRVESAGAARCTSGRLALWESYRMAARPLSSSRPL